MSVPTSGQAVSKESKESIALPSATVRFAGDSGDGMQLAGMRFTDTSAVFGNDIATLPDFPAEIRAPAGTVAGVSGFQINFAATEIFTPGDRVHALIAMNPAALKANLHDVEVGGLVVVNSTEFDKNSLRKAGYPEGYHPLEDEKILHKYKIYQVPITRLTRDELSESGLTNREADRCKNMFALGLVYWLFDRPLELTEQFLEDQFLKKKNLPVVAQANIKALRAGYNLGETTEMFPVRYHVPKAKILPGKYRRITGNEALALGLVAAAKLAGKQLIYCTYPITPATDVLHNLAPLKSFGVKTFQAEDEIAAVCSAIGVSFAGQLGVTGTSGPGLALKSEGIGLAVMTELPLIVLDVQRGGPSTGLPTKTEQADLLQAMFGRNSSSPVVILAPNSPADCFDTAIEAVKIALTLRVPVVLLSDGYIANGAEPWHLPDVSALPAITVNHATDPATFQPYSRDENLARPWAVPGTPELHHRIGGLEKQHITGNISYDGHNHQLMCELRQAKVDRLADKLPPLQVEGPETGALLLLGWGGTYGAIATAGAHLRSLGHSVAVAHLRHLNPMPANLGDVLKRYDRVLIPELNEGQLRLLIRAKYLCDARGLNKIQGQPFLVEELVQAALLLLNNAWGDAVSMQPHQHQVRVEDQDLDKRLAAMKF